MNAPILSRTQFDISQTKGMVAVINDESCVTALNENFLRFLGFARRQMLHFPLPTLVVPEEQAQAQALCSEALSGNPVYGHLAFTTSAGERKIMNVVLTPLIFNDIIQGAHVFLKDVTETVIKNKKVHDSEQRLAALFNTAIESIQVFAPNGQLLDVNGAGLQMLGVASSTDVIGKPFLPFVHEDDRESFVTLHHHVCNGQNGTLQYRLYNRQQNILWVESNAVPLRDKYGNIYAILCITRDVSEKKQQEMNLLLSEQKFRSLVQSGSDLIFVIDENAYIQYASPAVKDIAGYEPDYLLGKQAFQFLHKDDLHKIDNELKNIKAFINDGIATAHRFLTSSGKWIWLESKGANLLQDAHVRGMVINSRDVTDRIHLQEKLDRELANRQKKITAAVIKAQETERAQLGQELHDNVNQVLTTVKLYNEMLAGDLGPRQEILNKSSQYLQLCIDEIRSISKRLSAPTLGKISLTESVQELIESINLTNKLSIHYSVKGFETVAVSQDVHLGLYRIIQEHLNNIIKHAGAQHVFIEIGNTAQHLLLVIRDDGNGFNTEQKRRGIGITNMITRAENMNGRLHLQSSPGNGCTLKVVLPPLTICQN